MSAAQENLSTVAFCWKIERRDGAGIALTSHDRDLTIDEVTFHSAPGVSPSAIIRSSGLDPQPSDFTGALSSPLLDQDELLAGRWDGARMQFSAAAWTQPDAPPSPLLEGELGELSFNGESFNAELRGVSARLDAPISLETSPQCRADLGDPHCRVDLAGRSVRATIVAQEGVYVTLDHAVDQRFAFGRLRWMSGPMTGIDSIILSVQGEVVRLREPARLQVEAPVQVELREGCDKLFATCVSRFDNAVNFRGEPHLPGNDLLTRYPGGN